MAGFIKCDHTLKNELIGKIKALIINGSLKPGDRLPTERKMCELFGVSRSVIRDDV